MRICLKYHPVNMGDVKQGSIHQDDIEIDRLIAGQEDSTVAGAVFTDLETLQKVVEELIRADLGICINISGLLDEVKECCRRAGIIYTTRPVKVCPKKGVLQLEGLQLIAIQGP